jgi:hypothetical protein
LNRSCVGLFLYFILCVADVAASVGVVIAEVDAWFLRIRSRRMWYCRGDRRKRPRSSIVFEVGDFRIMTRMHV